MSENNYCPQCKKEIDEDEIQYLDQVPECRYPTDHAHPAEYDHPICPDCGSDLLLSYTCPYCEETYAEKDAIIYGKEHVCPDCVYDLVVRDADLEYKVLISMRLMPFISEPDLDKIKDSVKRYYGDHEDE